MAEAKAGAAMVGAACAAGAANLVVVRWRQLCGACVAEAGRSVAERDGDGLSDAAME